MAGIVSIVVGFNTIISILKLGFTTIQNLINGLISFFFWLIKIIDYMLEITTYYPNWISGFIVLGMGISVIMLIANRHGGKS